MSGEKIIIAEGVSEAELLRSLAQNGIDTFGLRVCSPLSAAQYALAKQNIFFDKRLLSDYEAEALMFKAMRANGYFDEKSYADARALNTSLRSMRSLITSADEPGEMAAALAGGEFAVKNSAIKYIYNKFMKSCAEENCVDSVAYIREATVSCREIGIPVICLKEMPLTPLARKLADILSGGKAVNTSLVGLYRLEERDLKIGNITRAYGESNEAENIIADILKNGYSFDSCTIALPSGSVYPQIFFDITQRYGIAVTFGGGVPIINSNPAKLLRMLKTYNNEGMRGKSALKSLLYCDALDYHGLEKLIPEEERLSRNTIINSVGAMRLSMDDAENKAQIESYRNILTAKPDSEETQNLLKALACIEIIFSQLAQGYRRTVAKYCVIRKERAYLGRMDRAALKVIENALLPLEESGQYCEIEQIIPVLLNRSVCSETSKEGAIHVTSFRGAQISLRKHLYIAGLGAEYFPGKLAEDPVLLDCDYDYFANENDVCDDIPLAENKLIRSSENLKNLLKLYSAADIAAEMSYSYFNLTELKEENAAAQLYEIYAKAAGKDASFEAYKEKIKSAGFFSGTFTAAQGLGKAFSNGEIIPARGAREAGAVFTENRLFSPTAIEMFVSCPRKFMYKYILKCLPDESDNPAVWMNPLDKGLLAHALMKRLAEEKPGEIAFLALVSDTLREFRLARKPIGTPDKDEKEFSAMMLNAYKTDPHNEVVFSEHAVKVAHPSGITLNGRADRLEKTPEGTYTVVDYKTGGNIGQVDNDAVSCLQTLLYAYAFSCEGYPVTACEYRYITYGYSICCENSAEAQAYVTDVLDSLNHALECGEFEPALVDKDTCEFCEAKYICKNESSDKDE